METRRETGRIEGFSDAVFAIAITLLALDLKVPTVGRTGLVAQLLSDWRAHLAWLSAFGAIAVMYMFHHKLFSMIRRTDGILFLLNFGVLLGIVTIPFWTSIMIAYARDPGRIVAAALHGGTIVVILGFYILLWSHAAQHQLLEETVGPRTVRATGQMLNLALVLYLATFFVALVSDVAATALNNAIALGFIVLGPSYIDRR